MIIQQDTREKEDKKKYILDYFQANGIKTVRSKLYVGDWTRLDKQDICIDTKKDLQEVYQNVILSNVRFKNECIRAKEAGISLIVLVADEEITAVSDVHKWKNKRREKWFMINNAQKKGKMLYIKQSTKPPASSEQLQRAMFTMSERYGVLWQFCKTDDVGKRIIEILEGFNG